MFSLLGYSVMSSDENNITSCYLAANPMLLQHHEDWHEQNPFPWPPGSQDRRPPGFQNPWPGRDPDYGLKFLNMHRYMICEFNRWRRTNGITEVISWDPSKPIPADVDILVPYSTHLIPSATRNMMSFSPAGAVAQESTAILSAIPSTA